MNIVKTYQYRDELGELLYENCRLEPKDFRQRRPAPDNPGQYIWGLNGTQRVLYHLDELVKADRSEWIFFVEGEKDCDRLRSEGLTATTAGSESAWRDEFATGDYFYRRKVCILPDNDATGRRLASKVAKALQGNAEEIRIVELPGLPEKGDVSDWLDNGGAVGELLRLIEAAPAYEEPETYRLTDTGNADRFVKLHGKSIKWCGERGRWLIWTGQRWKEDICLKTERLAEETVKAIYVEASEAIDSKQRESISKWARKSDSQRGMAAMLECAKHKLATSLKEFDADPWTLNCNNGLLDLRTGKLRPHDSSELVRKLAPVDFVPEAECQRWERFLSEIMAENDELIVYLRRLVGYCLTGDVREHILPIAYGTGANGKSTFMDTLAGIMGDYADQAPATLLTARRGDEHPTEIAFLYGKRLVIASETEEGRKLKTSLVKSTTGDAKLTGRYMRRDFFSFERTHKTLLATNHKPIITESSHAIWRRIQLIPFAVTIPDDSQDKELLTHLHDEWPGILAWAVRGCLDWRENGLNPPEAVQTATNDYRTESDHIGDFLSERVSEVEGCHVPKQRMRDAYCEWCKAAGEEQLSNRAMAERFRLHGLDDSTQRVHGKPKKVWLNVLLGAINPDD